MAIYEYAGIDKKGKQVKGLKEADNVRVLRTLLKNEGIFATKIKESTSGFTEATAGKSLLRKEVNLKALFQTVKIQDIGLATRQLATLLQAGVPMVDALRALVEQVDNEAFKRILSQVRTDVNEGQTLANALKKHACFTTVYVNMVQAGETSGALEIVLDRLADFTEGQSQLRSKVTGAMVYPAVMFVVAVLVMLLMMTTVVPRIASMFQNAKVQLPFATRMLIGLTGFLKSFWWLVLILLAAFIYGFIRYIKTPKGRALWDRFRLRVPVFGPILQMISIARFARTAATLLSGGVPLLTTLQIVRNVVSNDALEKAIDKVRDAVREGEDIATPLKRSGEFPPMVTHMIAIGEKSGQLETMLGRIATAYEARVENRVGVLTSLLEPAMILFMGGTIGFMVFAIMTPIMQMSQMVK